MIFIENPSREEIRTKANRQQYSSICTIEKESNSASQQEGMLLTDQSEDGRRPQRETATLQTATPTKQTKPLRTFTKTYTELQISKVL